MKTEPARVGALCADSLPFSESGTAEQARALAADGIEAVYGYLGMITPARVSYIIDAGMAFMPVTFAGRYSGPDAVRQLQGLSLPSMVTVCVDIEGLAAFHDPDIEAKINGFADAVNVDYMAGGYFGSPQPFTSEEMWKLRLKRYWRGQGRIADRYNALAEPSKCGWCVTQVFPSVIRGGVLVDIDVIGQDYLRRVPNWVVRD